MTEKLFNDLSNTEDLLIFYNKYLGLGNDDAFLLQLVQHLVASFKNKYQKEETLETISKKDLKLNEEDFQGMAIFQKNCLQFFETAQIAIDEDLTILINQYGQILKFIHVKQIDNLISYQENRMIGKPIQKYFSQINVSERTRKDLKNVILQNLLVSKIYKAVYENLYLQNINDAGLFLVHHIDTVLYEEHLNTILDVKECLTPSLGRNRSRK